VQTALDSDLVPPDLAPYTSRNKYSHPLPRHLLLKVDILKNNPFEVPLEYADRASNLTNLVQQLDQY
jgi:hypothetical protein